MTQNTFMLISARDLIAAVVVNLHDDYRRNPRPRPGVIAPSLTEAVAGDFSRQTDSGCGYRHDAPRLHPADGLFLLPPIRKHILPVPVREVFFECGDSLLIYGNLFLLSGLLFGQHNMGVKAACFKIINILQFQLQKVADSECGAGTQHNQGIIAKLALFEKNWASLFS